MIKYEVLVLVGGKGTRVNKFTKKVPKCLIKFNKKPFLYYQLKYLKNNGIKNVLLSSCYLNKKIETYVRKNINFINVKIVNDGKPLGTGGAVRKSIRFMKKYFFIIYGDSYFNFKLTKLIKNKNLATMAIFKNKNLYDRSNIRLKNGNKIEYFRDTANEELNFIDYGASYVSKSIFVDIKKNKKFELPELFEKISKKNMLSKYIVKKRFYEIGSYSGINDFKNYLKRYEIN